MRLCLLVFLVGCWTSAQPAPTQPTPEPAAPAKPVTARPMTAHEQVMARMEGFAGRMCGCQDKACADAVQEDIAQWASEMAKASPDEPVRMSDEETKHMAEVTKQYGDCMMKAMGAMSGNPCAGP
jgi:hypothetical protein